MDILELTLRMYQEKEKEKSGESRLLALRSMGYNEGMKIFYTIKEDENNWSAHRVLKEKLGFSGLLIKQIRNEGLLTVDGKRHRTKDSVFTGQVMCADDFGINPIYPEPFTSPDPKNIPIIYQDDWILVCCKPANLVTHPTYLHHECNLTAKLSPHLLHPINRLDRDTSGLVLIGKNGYAHHRHARIKMTKEYIGFVHGIKMPDHGVIHAPISRALGSIIMREINPEGQEAITHFTCLQRWPKANISLLKFRLETGRTHQIRVHCLYEGMPLVGETLYGCNRFFETWPLRNPGQRRKQGGLSGHVKLVNPENLITNEGVPATVEELARAKEAQTPGQSYMGDYQLPREKIGDLKENCPSNLNQDQCLFWDQQQTRQALHAYHLAFYQPIIQKDLDLYARPSEDLQHLFQKLCSMDNSPLTAACQNIFQMEV